jgi:hypothetical protein
MEHGGGKVYRPGDSPDAGDPAGCFSPERLDLLLYHIGEGLNGIIRTIRWAYRKTTWLQPIFLNGYDYPIPDGRGFTSDHGGWVTTMMDEVKVDPDMVYRKEVMRLLMDAINDRCWRNSTRRSSACSTSTAAACCRAPPPPTGRIGTTSCTRAVRAS